ncbi:hypothetical protein [Kitasatospora herbaricolor]|uniref:Gram-positive cocci surface proteins LPxTG domain-containing protein n=1 Tax=Kitasatospora herbaricolor TaxID=68217 RepID=A0ABZ1WHM4_9ACTN|nr:hypothetical protein [Kitasatospora herbaricolor]
MSTRRSLILAGTTALVLSTLPADVAGAVAVASPAGPSAAASVPHLDVSLQRGLEPSVAGVPREFEAGGAPREFGFTLTNPTDHDFVAFALLKFRNQAGDLRGADLKVEYQLPGRTDWLAGSLAPGGEGPDGSVLMVLGGRDGGDVSDDALLAVRKGRTLVLKVRTSFVAQAPAGKAAVAAVTFAARLDDRTGLPVDQGSFGCACAAGCAGFRIKEPTPPAPAPVATPTRTTAPTPAAPVTATPAGTPTRALTPTPAVTPTHSVATPTPAGTPTRAPASAPAVASSPAAPAATPAPATVPTAPSSPTSTRSTAPAPTAVASTPVGARPTASSSSATARPEQSSEPATADTGQLPPPFPMEAPTSAPLRIQQAAVVRANSSADAMERDLARTGGGEYETAVAGAGAALLGVGTGALVLLRRRRAARHR